ncbi:MAG: hypothetical protein J5911_01795 [Clostridia bacterium]|nr:hypothetical protein [Clostridia bacterium]
MKKRTVNDRAENELIKEIEKELKERSALKKREITEIFENIRRETENGEQDIDPSMPISEQDAEKYKLVLKYIIEKGGIKLSEIVKKFNIGYTKAVFFIEDFKKRDFVKFNKDTAKYDTITEERFREIFPD